MSSQIYPNWTGVAASVQVNSQDIASPANFNDLDPTAPTGKTNITWGFTGSDVSASLRVSDNFSISVEQIPISDDYEIFCNHVDLNIQVNSSFPPNGNPIYVQGSPV